MFFWIPSSKNLSPIMQCKREQMGKGYGKGLWRAAERNMTTQCVTHQLAAATSPSTRHAKWWNQPRCLRAGWLCGRECNERNSRFTCVSFENTNKEQSSSKSQQRRNQSRGQPGKQWSCTFKFPNVNWESALSCLFISSDASAFSTVTLRASLCLGMLPPERRASSHAWCGLPNKYLSAYMACMHSLNISRARQLIWFQIGRSVRYLLWLLRKLPSLVLGSIIYKTANMTYCWGCLYSR